MNCRDILKGLALRIVTVVLVIENRERRSVKDGGREGPSRGSPLELPQKGGGGRWGHLCVVGVGGMPSCCSMGGRGGRGSGRDGGSSLS